MLDSFGYGVVKGFVIEICFADPSLKAGKAEGLCAGAAEPEVVIGVSRCAKSGGVHVT